MTLISPEPSPIFLQLGSARTRRGLDTNAFRITSAFGACVETHWHSPHLDANIAEMAMLEAGYNRLLDIIFDKSSDARKLPTYISV